MLLHALLPNPSQTAILRGQMALVLYIPVIILRFDADNNHLGDNCQKTSLKVTELGV